MPAGLDYGAVYAVAATLGIAVTPALLGSLRVLEAEAAAALARRR